SREAPYEPGHSRTGAPPDGRAPGPAGRYRNCALPGGMLLVAPPAASCRTAGALPPDTPPAALALPLLRRRPSRLPPSGPREHRSRNAGTTRRWPGRTRDLPATSGSRYRRGPIAARIFRGTRPAVQGTPAPIRFG